MQVAGNDMEKCLRELKRGTKYLFPYVCDKNSSGFCRQSGIAGHRLCEAGAFSMELKIPDKKEI